MDSALRPWFAGQGQSWGWMLSIALFVVKHLALIQPGMLVDYYMCLRGQEINTMEKYVLLPNL